MTSIRYYFILMASMLFLSSCHNDLNDTVWIEDDHYHGLPTYSEWGYNTYGCYINDNIFSSGEDDHGAIILELHDGVMSLTLSDRCETMLHRQVQEMRFDVKVGNDCSVLDLHKKQFNLADTASVAVWLTFSGKRTDNETQIRADVQSGSLNMQRVQVFYVDGGEKEKVASGTFDMELEAEGKHYSIEYGRFDFGF